MSKPAIQVLNLGKRFRIGKAPTAGQRQSFFRGLLSPFNYLITSLREPSPDETIWSLRDVSFTVPQGEVVGIIGKNGAGKSTLLKILSRIIEPTEGKALIRGRVGSLLEVGTGFHPELTGRENIYLNGAILGMRKTEIDRKFDAIVAFAETEKFIDTAVKRYSSGMYVRLAFSVAAHLEPDILLIDEVLAVGDLSFQQKCLERIKSLTDSGMTVLLVSHNMAAIQSACKRAIFLHRGEIASTGEPIDVIDEYRRILQQNKKNELDDVLVEKIDGASDSPVTITGFELLTEDGRPNREIRFGEPARFRIHLHASRRFESPMINFGVKRGDGVVTCNFNNWYDNFMIDYLQGDCVLEGWLPALRLVPEFYEIHVLVWPWGGGHQAGGIEGSRPVAWSSFGDFRITGPALNSHDGIIQVPMRKWQFSRGNYTAVSTDIDEMTIQKVLAKPDRNPSATPE